MDIRKMTDEKLAKVFRKLYWANTTNGGDVGDICDDDIKIAKFIRLCVKDSVPEELSKEKLALCVSEAISWFPETPNVLKSVCIETLAENIHTALYDDTKPDERKGGENNHVA